MSQDTKPAANDQVFSSNPVTLAQQIEAAGAYDALSSLQARVDLALMVSAGYSFKLWPLAQVLEAALEGEPGRRVTLAELVPYVQPAKQILPETRERYLRRWFKWLREANRARPGQARLLSVEYDNAQNARGDHYTIVTVNRTLPELRSELIRRLPADLAPGDEGRAKIFDLAGDVLRERGVKPSNTNPGQASGRTLTLACRVKTMKKHFVNACRDTAAPAVAVRFAQELPGEARLLLAHAMLDVELGAIFEGVDVRTPRGARIGQLYARLTEAADDLEELRGLLSGAGPDGPPEGESRKVDAIIPVLSDGLPPDDLSGGDPPDLVSRESRNSKSEVATPGAGGGRA